MYFKSKKDLNYNKFVDPNIHSDLRIYQILFFLLDIMAVHPLVYIKILQCFNPYNAEICLETKGIFQFEIIINVLVSSFCFI